MKSPLVSIIVPVYNTKNYLPDCLDSLKAQTYPSLEIILIDDGSTDGSDTLLKAYASLDSRAKVFHKTNGGLSSARNYGIARASGEYLFFLDSDDSLASGAIEYYVRLAQGANSLISIAPHLLKKTNGKSKDFNSAGLKTSKLSIETALKLMLNERGFNLQSTGKLFHRSLFEKKGKRERILFPENKLHEDVGTTYRLFLRAARLDPCVKIAFGSRPQYNYCVRNTSITNSGFNLKKLDLIIQTDAMCAAVEQAYPSLNNTANLRRMHARFSILRMLIGKNRKTDRERRIEDSLVSYLKAHKAWVLKNPEAGKRDKFAMLSLLLGRKIFQFAWYCYSVLK